MLFLCGVLLRISKFAIFFMIQGKTFCRNYLCSISLILFIGFKSRKFTFFPMVEMAANYAKTDRAGN